jgi:hypothetical protein
MMKNKLSKKLQLNKTVIADLNPLEMNLIRGGTEDCGTTPPPPTTEELTKMDCGKPILW